MRFLVVVVLLVGIYWLCGRRSRSEYYSSVVFVNGTAPIARTDSDFVCATLDWWPPQKCDYTACSWGSASLLNLDLNNPTLINAVRAFSPLKIRLGGTLQDKVVYQETENEKQPCTPFVKNDSALFGFSQGCLSMSRWDELNNFFNKTRAFVVFGLNALTGKIISSQGSATGAWDSGNAESLIRYTVEKGYTIHGWELGNELSGSGIGARISPGQYASDINRLQDIVQQVYAGFEAKPLVLGPGGFFDRNWFTKFISKTPKSLQVVTHHIYNLGPGSGEHLIEKILNPSVLGSVSGDFESLQSILKRSRSSAVAWVGEAGGAYNSGQNHVTNAFAFSFWYLDQFGMAATYDTKAYCRQSLIGGNYGLLNTNTFVPNPDYYSALLWHRLMGTNVLSARFSGTAKVRSYAHCTKKTQGITLLLINLEKSTTVHVSVSIEKASSSKGSNVSREEYHLTPRDGDLHSQTVLLNGKVLSIDPLGNIPPLEPIQKLESDPITVAPFSIVFAIIPNVNVPACN